MFLSHCCWRPYPRKTFATKCVGVGAMPASLPKSTQEKQARLLALKKQLKQQRDTARPLKVAKQCRHVQAKAGGAPRCSTFCQPVWRASFVRRLMFLRNCKTHKIAVSTSRNSRNFQDFTSAKFYFPDTSRISKLSQN